MLKKLVNKKTFIEFKFCVINIINFDTAKIDLSQDLTNDINDAYLHCIDIFY